MRTASIHLLALALALQLASAAAKEPIQHAPDGGSILHVQSIDIPSIPNAPFSAVVVTDLTTIMPDGSKRTTWNHRLVARDSAGRVFQERRYFTPNGRTETTRLSQLQYEDPTRSEMLLCSPDHTCRAFNFSQTFAAPPQNLSLPAHITLADGTTIQREDLGHNTIEGVDAVGSREITTIPAAVLGADKPQPLVKEFWYSPRLGINLVTKRFDPRVSSIQNFTVTQINLSEPDPKLFEPPADAHVVRMGRQ